MDLMSHQIPDQYELHIDLPWTKEFLRTLEFHSNNMSTSKRDFHGHFNTKVTHSCNDGHGHHKDAVQRPKRAGHETNATQQKAAKLGSIPACGFQVQKPNGWQRWGCSMMFIPNDKGPI